MKLLGEKMVTTVKDEEFDADYRHLLALPMDERVDFAKKDAFPQYYRSVLLKDLTQRIVNPSDPTVRGLFERLRDLFNPDFLRSSSAQLPPVAPGISASTSAASAAPTQSPASSAARNDCPNGGP